jgi:hypothetical protein
MKKIILLMMVSLYGCETGRIYECDLWEERQCICPNGSIGEQECSRGPAFAQPKPPRTWPPCSCCFDKRESEHGISYTDKNDASGCWEDTYDPSTGPFEVDVKGSTE